MRKSRKSYTITIISLILISTAGASFNNVIRSFLETFLQDKFGVASKLSQDIIIFFIFLIILLILGFGFKPVFKRIARR